MSFDLETAYIGLESPHPPALARFFEDVIGLQPAQRDDSGTLAWRNDHRAQRVFATRGPRADAACTGFEARDERAFDRICASLRRAGARLEEGDATLLKARRVRSLARCETPWGVALEIVLGLEDAGQPFVSPHYPRGFVTQGQGFGHFVFGLNDKPAYDQAVRLATEGLGMRVSDWLRMPIGPGAQMHVTFLHCNPRHHSMALAFIPAPELPKRLHHINFEVREVAEVGSAYERVLRSGTPIANALGQHDNDRMVSFYCVSPDGWQVEVGATGVVVDEHWQGAREYDRISVWGHQPPQILQDLFKASQGT